MGKRETPLQSRNKPGEGAEVLEVQEIDKSESILGQVLANKYAILSELGQGGMAIVYKAKEVATGKLVAIKALRYADRDLEARFALEMKIHSKLKHINIVDAIDCLEIGGRAYFVMELLEGIDLEQLIVRRKRLDDVRDIGVVLSQICDCLEYAHDEGIIHRDVKPENIILVSQGGQTVVKVLDFGVAKLYEDMQRLTKDGIVLGSPAYMSPEQCMGLKLDPRADIYSLGVVAYELVTGSLPHNAKAPLDMMDYHCTPEKKPTPIKEYRADLPGREELQSIFDRALETDPNERHQTIDEIRTELNLWWRVATVGEYLDSPFVAPNRSGKRKKTTKQSQEARQRVINTIQTNSLLSLVAKNKRFDGGQEATLIEPSRERPPLGNSQKLNSVMGWVGFVLLVLFLSAVLAFFIISSLNSSEESATPTQQSP